MKAILMSCNNCDREYAFETVSKYIKPGMKVVCVPFASELNWQLKDDYDEYKERHFNVFKKFGVSEDNLDIVKLIDSKDDIIDKLVEADVVFFSGGYMENALFIIDYLDLKYVFEYVKEAKIIMGESAGTLIMLDEYMEVPYVEDAYKHYKKKRGLGYISKFNLIVHYDKNNPKHVENKEKLKEMEKDKLVLCLSDESMLIIDGDKNHILGQWEV